MHGLESVPDIGQGTPDDDAHCVVEIALPDLVFDIDAYDFFGELSH